MKKVLALVAVLTLTACVDINTPQNGCGDGYVNYVTPAGTSKCIKPGMSF